MVGKVLVLLSLLLAGAARAEGFGFGSDSTATLDRLFMGFFAITVLMFLTSGGFIHGLRRGRWRLRKRYPCVLPVTITVGGTAINARLVDISGGGVRVRTADPLPQDVPMAVRILGQELPASIAWAGDEVVGLRFERSLQWRELRAILDAARDARHRIGHGFGKSARGPG